MPKPLILLCITALLAAIWTQSVGAEKRTVCTITVNSADEKEIFRRSLPPDKFQFVELVQQGGSDALESACRRGVRCDVLLISGHHDGESGFFSDRVDAREFLSVDEMERVSCSESCSGVFSQLKEVYLFGCNTLNADPVKSASGEVMRSLVRAGHSRADAERLARSLSDRHANSTREQMRLIFHNVAAIYGFSTVAPLGATAGSVLSRYFRSGGAGEVGSGHANAKLLKHFAAHSMVVASGLKASDPQAAYRRDVCQFSDERLSAAQKLRFVHQLLGGEMAEVRMFLDRIEKYFASLTNSDRQVALVAQALEEIVRDKTARARYLEFARDADQAAIRARMVELAHRLGWLSSTEKRAELVQMISDQLARNAVGAAEVDLVCSLNKTHELDQELPGLRARAMPEDKVGHAGVMACLGDAQAHTRVLQALTSANDEEMQIAEAYLHQRPIADVNELRALTTAITRMNGSRTQVRALDTLARQRLADPETLEALTRLFARADSVGVQTAIAGILLRSDHAAIVRPELVQTLRQHRLKSSAGEDAIDVLIRRLEPPQPVAHCGRTRLRVLEQHLSQTAADEVDPTNRCSKH